MNRCAWAAALSGCLAMGCPGLPPAGDDEAAGVGTMSGAGGRDPAGEAGAQAVVPGLGGSAGSARAGSGGDAGEVPVGGVGGTTAGSGGSSEAAGAGSRSTGGASAGGGMSSTGGSPATGATGGSVDMGGSGTVPAGGGGAGTVGEAAGKGGAAAGAAGSDSDAPPCEGVTGEILWSQRVAVRASVSSASDGYASHSLTVDMPSGLATSLGCGFLFGGSSKNGKTGSTYFDVTGLSVAECFSNDLASLGAKFNASLDNQVVKWFAITDDVRTWSVVGFCLRTARNDWTGTTGDVDDTWEIWGTP